MTIKPLDLPSDDSNRKPRNCGAAGPLTPEQEQFARVLGRILAQLWHDEQRAKASKKPDTGQSTSPNS